MPERTRTDARRSRARRPGSSETVRTRRSRGGRSTQASNGVILVLPRYRMERSIYVHYADNAGLESSFAFSYSPFHTPASGIRRTRRSSHYSGCYGNQDYKTSRRTPASKAYYKNAQKNVYKSKLRKRKDQSLGSMATGLGSIPERSRRIPHRRPSRAPQDLRYTAAAPSSQCSSSRGSIERAPLPQSGEEYGQLTQPNDRRAQGFIEPGSLKSSRASGTASSVIHSSRILVPKSPLPSAILSPDTLGILASRRPWRKNWGVEWDQTSYRSDFSNDTDSGLHLKGHLAPAPQTHTSRSAIRTFLSQFKRTYRGTNSTKKSRLVRGVRKIYDHYTKSKGHAIASEFVNRRSEGFNETDGGSIEVNGGANRLGELPEPTNEDSCQAAPGCRSNWASTMCQEISNCTGSKYEPEQYEAARKNELLRQICI